MKQPIPTPVCHIFDPTGNITALVEGEVPASARLRLAAEIMRAHSDVEQVGFVSPCPFTNEDAQGELPALAMAGGEFCGNAAMSAAALFLLEGGEGAEGVPVNEDGTRTVRLAVSGASHPVTVSLERKEGERFVSCVTMPPVLEILTSEMRQEQLSATVPVVRMEGITHLIIGEDSPFFSLRERTEETARLLRTWCQELDAMALGLMFFERKEDACALIPVVYVPEGDTVYREHSCASGSAALAAYLADSVGAPADIALTQPGGTLRVTSDPATREIRLYGETLRRERFFLSAL